ncbi:MAG: lamin tail domain-containing protein [Deltaproteobacteria bacterium]|nr:lamin tail domain-containing protein [Deltaproteobacteria bacterium]
MNRPNPHALAALLIALSQTLHCAPEEPTSQHRVLALERLDVEPTRAHSSEPPSETEPALIERIPVFSLTFARPLDLPDAESVWLLDGDSTDTLTQDARRGTLSASNTTRRIPAQVEWAATRPRELRVRPATPLWPAQVVTLSTTSRLRSSTGEPAAVSALQPQPITRTFRVQFAPDTAPIATMTAPAERDVPTRLRAIEVRFNRPLRPLVEGPVAWLEDSHQVEPPVNASLGCREATGWSCVVLVPDEPLAPLERYTVRLGVLGDHAGRPPVGAPFSFETSAEAVAQRPTFVTVPACVAGELRRGPVCVRVEHTRIAIRAMLDSPGRLSLRAGELAARSALSLSPMIELMGVPADAHMPLLLSSLDLGSNPIAEAVLEPVRSPVAAPRVSIREVFARPRSSAAQEFVELRNDGSSAISLGGLILGTASGRSELPDLTLPAGALAVIVGPTFDPRGDSRTGDPPLAPGAVLVRLARTIAQHGLVDRGADVWIADSQQNVISRVPASHPNRAPRLGISLVRADDTLAEGDPAAWAYDTRNSATPGSPDRIR